MVTKKFDINKAIRLYNDGNSLGSISKQLGVTKSAISYSFKKQGIEVSKPKPKTCITKQKIQKLLNNGETFASIARLENVSSTIIRRIYKNKTKTRNTCSVEFSHKISKDELNKLVQSRLTNIQIAEKLGYNRSTIGDLIKRYEINRPSRYNITKEKLENYLDKKLTIGQIAKIFGCGKSTIKKHIKEFKLRKKQLWESVEITNELKAIIIGIYLGDASISKPIKNMKSCLEYGHATDQGNLVRLVYQLLEPLMSKRKINVEAPTKKINEETFYRIRTIFHPYFTELRDKYYKENFFDNGEALKRIDLDLLNYMTDESLALWYFDDGYFSDFNNKLKVVFCTQRFLLEDVKLLIKFIKDKWNLDSYIKSKNKYLLTGHDIVLHERSVSKFEELLLPYIIKCVRYKFPFQFIIPYWESDTKYQSNWDIILKEAPNLPKPRIPYFIPQYDVSKSLKTINNNIKTITNYRVVQASKPEISDFLAKHHYLGRIKNSCLHFKLLEDDKLVGVSSFSKLRTVQQTKNMFNREFTIYDGLDVSRFACLDACGNNTESFFMSECIRGIKKISTETKFLVTYSQPEVGHHGYVYQSTNWIYVTSRAGATIRYILDGNPTTRRTLKRRHGKDSGGKEWREIYGDRLQVIKPPSKHKYLFVIDKNLNKCLTIPYNPYPKLDS